MCPCIASLYDPVWYWYCMILSFTFPTHLSVWASSGFLFVCICHCSSVVWWLRLWFLSSQRSSKYSDKTQRIHRSRRPGQSIREKTTQIRLFLLHKTALRTTAAIQCLGCRINTLTSSPCIFPPSSLSITISKTVTNPAVRAVNSICDGAASVLYNLSGGLSAQPVECSQRNPGGGWKAMNL